MQIINIFKKNIFQLNFDNHEFDFCKHYHTYK